MNYLEVTRNLERLNSCNNYLAFRDCLESLTKSDEPLIIAPLLFSNLDEANKIKNTVKRILTEKKVFIKTDVDKKRAWTLELRAKPPKPVLTIKNIIVLATIIFLSIKVNKDFQGKLHSCSKELYETKINSMKHTFELLEDQRQLFQGIKDFLSCNTELSEIKIDLLKPRIELPKCEMHLSQCEIQQSHFVNNSRELQEIVERINENNKDMDSWI